MSNKNYNNSTGIGFVGMLQISFIVLKLLNIITWSWVWVLAPFWISVIILIISFLVLLWLVNKQNR